MIRVIKKQVFLQCRRCAGSGWEEITGHLYDTYQLLRGLKCEATAAGLAADMGITGMAMSNRLAILEKMGFATSRRYGRERFYKAVMS